MYCPSYGQYIFYLKSTKVKNFQIIIIGFLLGVAGSLDLQAQSGWVREKNSLFAKLYVSGMSSDKYFNPLGNELKTATFRQLAFALYGEYGITSYLTLYGTFPFFKVQGFETTDNTYGIGDFQPGLRLSLLKGKFPLSISLASELPTGKSNNFATNKVNSFEQINLPSGDGELNLWSILAVSHSFYPKPAYASFHLGYNYRTKYESLQLSDQVQAGLEFGYKFKDKLWMNATLKILNSLGDPQQVDFIRGEGTSYTSWLVGATYALNPKWGVSASLGSYSDILVKRENIYSAPMLSLGIEFTK